MKKVFSILFASVILISGMHLSIAKHICGGEVVAVKWSFSGEKATCGMENPKETCPVHNGIASNCCRNEFAFYAVDNNYCPFSFQIKDITKKLSKIFLVPVNLLFYSTAFPLSSYEIVWPPDKIFARAVSLADICVFRN
jgi:hypothetical protein